MSDKERRIQVFVGETRSRKNVARIHELGWGRIWTDANPQVYPWEPWAFDNGAYSAHLAGRPFPVASFQRRLVAASLLSVEPVFAVLPDIVAGGMDSLYFSLQWADRKDENPHGAPLPDKWLWYLAVQDGMTPIKVLPYLSRFDGIFIGGTSAFKATAPEWVELAHEHDKPCHYGRAGTPAKLEHAIESGADSCDSSFPLWTQERFDHFVECWRNGNPQRRLAV